MPGQHSKGGLSQEVQKGRLRDATIGFQTAFPTREAQLAVGTRWSDGCVY